jgi:hypothetical protein
VGLTTARLTSRPRAGRSSKKRATCLGHSGLACGPASTCFRFEGRLYRQVERYFVAHVPAFDPLSQELGAEEAKAFSGLRWWTPAELEEADETFPPTDLPALVRTSVEDGPPEQPIEVGA